MLLPSSITTLLPLKSPQEIAIVNETNMTLKLLSLSVAKIVPQNNFIFNPLKDP